MERLSDSSSKGGRDLQDTTTPLGEYKFKHPLSDWTENTCETSSQTVPTEEVSTNAQLVEPTIEKLTALHISSSCSQDPEADVKDVSSAEATCEEETTSSTKTAVLEDKLSSLRARSSEIRKKIETRQTQASLLKHELTTKTSEFQRLEIERDLLKAAFDKEEPPHKQLDPQMLESLELETKAIISEIQKREEERCKLSSELTNRPKAPSRASYINRITEITKNSRKQDADIERILKDTRDIQIESNSIQERLHRTYIVAEEKMFRDVKKDPVREKAYRLLTTIHNSFGEISEKILATDRIRREIVELEAKIATGKGKELLENQSSPLQ